MIPNTTRDDATIDNIPFGSLELGGWTLQGYSRAGIQNFWRIPELRIGFDLALLPWSFTEIPIWFVTHAHLDHCLALPTLLTRRRMMGLPPPTVYVPASIVPDIENLFRAWERLDRGKQECDLRGIDLGDRVELPSKHRVLAFPTMHTVPSQGYLVVEPRRKLREPFRDLPGEEIRVLRARGIEVVDEVEVPLFAYTGDTSREVFAANPILFGVKTLLIEMSFLQESPSPTTAQRHGHLHLEDFLEHAPTMQNERLILMHFSSRYSRESIRTTLYKRLPESLRQRVYLWIEDQCTKLDGNNS